MKERACKHCGRLTNLDICTFCKLPTSTEWMGYVSIIDPENSKFAKRLEITAKGKYALRIK